MMVRRYINTPGWNLYSGLDELEMLRREMDKVNNRLMERSSGRRAGVFPLINVTEDKENYYLRAELPGINTNELDIEATGTTVSLSGERKIPAENENAKYHRREREAGKFSRMISLSTEIDTDAVEAELVNGILKVKLPKSEKAKPRKISVN